MQFPIYLDYMATTPVDPRVKEKMDACLTIDGNFGNASSSSHIYGQRAKEAIELARAQVADLMNANSEEILFTSCATESNNLALKGAAQMYARKGKHIITCATEHKAVLNPCKYLATQGYELTILTPGKNGLINLEELKAAIRKDTILVSIMYVNNEIGVIQDIPAIGALVKSQGIIFHVDAVQAAGKIPLDVKTLPVDLMSFSAHKVYGPKGVGCLYIRYTPQRIRLEPQMNGGGHEFGLRSGTLPTHQIVAMGEAFAIAKQELPQEQQRISKLRDKLWGEIKTIGEVYLNGDLEHRVPNNLNLSFVGIKGEDLVTELKDIAISTSSACISTSTEPSYVLKAIGVSNALAFSSIRLSLGRFTTEAEVDYVIEHIKQGINKLRLNANLFCHRII